MITYTYHDVLLFYAYNDNFYILRSFDYVWINGMYEWI
jgi:hypothetical protein